MHEQFLLAALKQAQLGRGICAPNPSVGAVAVYNGKIIAQSHHQGAGTPHAEQIILKQLPPNLSGITLYVTLEPCNHWGKTPPCTEGIINYGIERVVFAYRDPNPIVRANDTSSILKHHGIEVIYHPMVDINDFYQSYDYWMRTKKPWVTVKIAQSIDGKIAQHGGQRAFLSNAACAEFTHQKRFETDVILTSAKTIHQDNPLLNARLPTIQRAKPVAILDRKRTLNQNANIFTTAKHCYIYHDDAHADIKPCYNSSYHSVPVVEGGLDLTAVINHLGLLGCHDVWVEAGGKLFTALHQAQLVNRTYVYITPSNLGPTAISAYHEADIFRHASKVTWQGMNDNIIAIFDWHMDREAALCLPV
jgi:diaminohydroxyphosphoribosylaminopyrimidine deaminase/5-amino-6-(5-phosphoribosylamino)uracil reductase